LLGHEGQNVLVHQPVCEADLLPPEPDAPPPDQCVLELAPQTLVKRVADIPDGRATPHDQGLIVVGLAPLRPHVDPDETKLVVDLLPELVHVHVSLSRDRENVAEEPLPDPPELSGVDHVYLVQHRHRGRVDPVPEQHVDELLVADVLAEHDAGVVDPVDAEDVPHRVPPDPLQRPLRDHRDAADRGLLDHHVGRPLVGPDPYLPQLPLEDRPAPRLKDVEDEQDEVSRPRDREDTPAEALPLRGAGYDPGQVQDLYPGAPVLHHARDHLERREVVSAHLRARVRDPVQDRRLPDAGQPDEDHRGVAALLDRVALRGSAAPGGRLLLLTPQLREPGLEHPEMPLRGLVDLRTGHLLLNLLDLLGDAHNKRTRLATHKNVSSAETGPGGHA